MPNFKKGKSNILLIVFYLILIYILSNLLNAYIRYDFLFEWWNKYNGSKYKGGFDVYSVALFNYSKVLFDIRQLLIPGQSTINLTNLLLLETCALSKIQMDSNPVSFVKPRHLCESITWGNIDYDIFCNGIDNYYGQNNNVASPGWYSEWVNQGKPGPEDSQGWSTVTGNTCGGFWPHLNGLTTFFGTNGDKPYDLGNNLSESRYIGSKGFSVYTPGSTGADGSWAQLFADWGIVYSLKDPSNSIIYINKNSNQALWTSSGFINNTNNTDPNIPPSASINFFSAFGILPNSEYMYAWVLGEKYNDNDPNAIPNLIGSPRQDFIGISGGWVSFLQKINGNNTNEYDDIYKDLFDSLITPDTQSLPISGKKDCTKKRVVSGLTSGLGGLLSLAFLTNPFTSWAGLGVIAASSAMAGVSVYGAC